MSSGPSSMSGTPRHRHAPVRPVRHARRLAELFQQLAYMYVQMANKEDAEDTDKDNE